MTQAQLQTLLASSQPVGFPTSVTKAIGDMQHLFGMEKTASIINGAIAQGQTALSAADLSADDASIESAITTPIETFIESALKGEPGLEQAVLDLIDSGAFGNAVDLAVTTVVSIVANEAAKAIPTASATAAAGS